MTANAIYPLRFAPVYKQALWGGDAIARRYARAGAPAQCSESWELSAHADGAGTLLNGPNAGATLAELCVMYGRALLGEAAPDSSRFPLLFKIIDASARLSVQVHPNDREAARTGAEAKSECWYLLDAAPGACLYAGLAPGASPETLRAALAAGRAEHLLARQEVAAGQSLYIPGGLVHAIGAGCLIYEVQQSSNTTYRLYDWNRTDATGRGRTLHLDAGLAAIDWSLEPPRPQPPPPATANGRNRWRNLVASPYFQLRRLHLDTEATLTPRGRSFWALFTERGTVEVTVGTHTELLAAGDSCLIPAAAASCRLRPCDPSTALLVTTIETED
ncbi:MAG: class I mannose-6-phosphate isomerase [Kiritimatiellae bacterium]|nr:class I mannose-6-phosphate isomerase [Kiritimatiellia bacterium]